MSGCVECRLAYLVEAVSVHQQALGDVLSVMTFSPNAAQTETASKAAIKRLNDLAERWKAKECPHFEAPVIDQAPAKKKK